MLMGGYMSFSALPLAISLALVMVLSVVAIFLYKKRKIQRGVVLGAVAVDVISIVIGAAYLYASSREQKSPAILNIRVVLPLVNLVLLLLASRGIKRDDNLVKSYDRLR